MEVTETRGKKCKQLLEDLKEKTGFLKLEEEALVRTLTLEEAMDLT